MKFNTSLFSQIPLPLIFMVLLTLPPPTHTNVQTTSSVYNYVTITHFDGFDACTVPSTSQMQTWKSSSPFVWANIYFGGLNRACSQPNLSLSWVQSIHNQGWDVVPTWVDYQPPCDPKTQDAVMSTNGSTAYTQGVNAANNAAAAAENIGIAPESILYDDLEYYNYGGSNPRCQNANQLATSDLAVANFVNGWSTTLHALNFRVGTYINVANVQSLCNYAGAINPPDDIWIAAWDNNESQSDITSLPPNGCWINYQRLHQYTANVSRLYGGVTLNSIDLNSSDGFVSA